MIRHMQTGVCVSAGNDGVQKRRQQACGLGEGLEAAVPAAQGVCEAASHGRAFLEP